MPPSFHQHMLGKGSFENALLDLMQTAHKVQRKNEASRWLYILPAPSSLVRQRAHDYVRCGTMGTTLVDALGDAIDSEHPGCLWT